MTQATELSGNGQFEPVLSPETFIQFVALATLLVVSFAPSCASFINLGSISTDAEVLVVVIVVVLVTAFTAFGIVTPFKCLK